MRECESGARSAKPSLAEFVDRIRGNECRLGALEERLRWIDYLICSSPGPSYGGERFRSDPYRNKIPELLDRKDRILERMKMIEKEEKALHEFESVLTQKELDVFHLYYFKDKSQADIALIMGISQQAVSQHIGKIEKKWDLFGVDVL